jgi:uncharacterized YigZ family protein
MLKNLNEPVQTIRQATEGYFKDRGSRFIAYLFPIDTRAAFEARHSELKVRHADATHICWAMRLGNESRSSDDGEPAHSAGAPILRQLVSRRVDRAALFVVRYFGGTKLGVPGLIHAYGAAAAAALDQAEFVEWIDKVRFVLIFPYHCTSAVERQLKKFGASVVESAYTEKCQLIVEVRIELQQLFQLTISECTDTCTLVHGSST